MSRKWIIVIVACSILLITSLFYLLYNVNGGKKATHVEINEGITRTKPFSISSDTTDLLTSVEGTVFYKNNVGQQASAQIIASIHIDSHDWEVSPFIFLMNG